MISAAEPIRCATAGLWLVELLPTAPYEASYRPENPVIGFTFDGQIGSHSFGSDRKTTFKSPPNGLAYIPAGCDVYSRSATGGEYLKLSRAGTSAGMKRTDRRFSNLADPFAIAAAHELRRLLLSRRPIEPLRIEQLLQTLEDRSLFFLLGSADKALSGAWMTARRLRIIDETIDSGLAGKITVQDLADVLNLSAGFFTRAFKAALGKSPHDYIIDRRVSVARSMLRTSGMGLTDIALAAGFSSHAHMTSTFRQRLGVRPVDVRASLH